MKKPIDHHAINFGILALTILIYPFSMKFSNACSLLLLLHWIIWLIRQPEVFTFRKSVVWIMILPFCVSLVSVLYAENKEAAFFSIEKKITLLILPLILGTIPTILRDQFRKVMFVACFSILVSFVYCLVRAFASPEPFLQSIFWQGFVSPLEMHPTYLSLYINFLIVWIFFDAQNHWHDIRTNQKLLIILTVFLFYLFLFLLSSKLQLVCAALIFIFLAFRLAQSVRMKIALAAVVVIAGALIWGLKKTYTIERFRHINTFSYHVSDDIMSFNEVTIRLAIAECSGEILKDNFFFGVGTGNVADELYKTYEKFDFKPGLKARLNPHNEYLSQLLATGIFGLLIFVATLWLNFKAAVRRKDIPNIVLLSLFIINFVFESMLELQRGILLFSIFVFLFFFHGEPSTESVISEKIKSPKD